MVRRVALTLMWLVIPTRLAAAQEGPPAPNPTPRIAEGPPAPDPYFFDRVLDPFRDLPLIDQVNALANDADIYSPPHVASDEAHCEGEVAASSKPIAAVARPEVVSASGTIVELQVAPTRKGGASLLIGYSLGDLTFGAGVHVYSRSPIEAETASPTSPAAIILQPGLRFTLARSRDQQVEAFGQFDVGIGVAFDSERARSSSELLVGWATGIGVRFWLHPQMAIGAVVGLQGDHTWDSLPRETVEGELAAFGTAQVVGRF